MLRASVMSRRRSPSICPHCALQHRLAAVEASRLRWLREGQVDNNRRVFWHPYVNDDLGVWVDVTGLTGTALLKATRIVGTMADSDRLASAAKEGRPFNDPRLGCLRYNPN